MKIERTIKPDIPETRVVAILDLLHNRLGKGAAGVTSFVEGEYIWCDDDGISRGCLSVWPAGDGKYSFLVRVHPAWRRHGIATKLYAAASRDFQLDEVEFTALGALWINSIEGG